MSFSLFDLHTQQIIKDESKIAAINNLPKNVVILKRDKRNRIVLLDINSWRGLVKHLLSDKSKFQTVENDQYSYNLILYNSTYENWNHAIVYQRKYTKEFVLKIQNLMLI